MDINLSEFSKNPYSGTFLNSIGFDNPMVLMTIIIIIVIYSLLFGSLGGEQRIDKEKTSASIRIIELILWSVFIILILFNGFNYIFNMDIVTSIKNFFSPEPTIDIVVKDTTISKPVVPEIMLKKQVFNIPNNNYTYEDAKAICKAYGSDLATWKDIKNAFENGADWCNYGWSKDQMILFPTQYNKWLKLQKIKGHENDCGRPGINGGYISNPNAKFGVNCYGYKPEMTKNDQINMMNTPLYPKTKKNIEFQRKVEYWKNKLMNIIVSPFNSNLWSVV